MRLIVADKRCENGHFIDESWDLCPYCPQESAESEIPVVRPARMQPERPHPLPPRPPATAVPPPSTAVPHREPSPPGLPPPRREPPPPVEPPPMERTVAVQKIDLATAQPHRYVVGWLVGLSGALRGESFPVRMGRNVLGRDRRSDVVVNDDQASAHHADLVFRPEEMRFILMDHNSTNGTYVNESEIEPRRDLSAGDIVRIGSHRLLFIPLCGEGYMWDSEGVLE